VKWWRWWEDKAPQDFLRTDEQLKHPIRRMIVEKVAEVGSSALDVGSGTCIDYPLFDEAGVDYVAIDITPKFLKYARGLHPIKAIRGDGLHLPIKSESFDVAYCKDLLEHLPWGAYRLLLWEMWRVARRRIIIAFFKAPRRGRTRYYIHPKGYFLNTYDKDEIKGFLTSLPDFGALRITEGIGFNKSALYVVDKL